MGTPEVKGELGHHQERAGDGVAACGTVLANLAPPCLTGTKPGGAGSFLRLTPGTG